MYITHGQDDTTRFGTALGKALRKGDVVLLYGDLGAGKSVLARGIARQFGITSPMASPTFTLMQPYKGKETIYHFDLYRISDADEYFAAGLDEFVGTDGIALIEWPIEENEAPPYIQITVNRVEGDTEARSIDVALCGMDDRKKEIFASIQAWEENT